MLFTGIVQTFAQAPKLNSFSPGSGDVGTEVTITGSGFSADTANNVVYFGATRATIKKATTSQLLVTVPADATYKPIIVINKATRLSGSSALSFSTTFPQAGTELNPPLRLPLNTSASSVRIYDIDGDGKTDILATNPVQGTLMVYGNKSKSGTIDTGSFAAPVIYPIGSQSNFVSVDDLDGDGNRDLVLMSIGYSTELDGNNSLIFFKNESTPGKIQLAAIAITDSTETAPANYNFQLKPNDKIAKIYDFDGDGRLDLAVLNAGGFVSIYQSVAGASLKEMFNPPVIFPVGLNPNSFIIGDLDTDGKPDLVTSSRDNSSITVLQNNSTSGFITASSFQPTDIPLGYQPLSVSLADVDGDGKLDIAITRSDNTFVLIHNSSIPGRLSVTSIPVSNLLVLSNYDDDIVMQDVDGDGKPDLLSLTADLKSVNLYTNKSTSGQTKNDYFNNEISYKLATIPDCIGDLNGDGRPEMIIGNYFGIDIYQSRPCLALIVEPPITTKPEDYMSIYPNPASTFTNVRYNLPVRSDVLISVIDNLGKIIKSFKTGEQAAGDKVSAVEISGLEKGFYVVMVSAITYKKAGKLIVIK